jgi:hypothetical protein
MDSGYRRRRIMTNRSTKSNIAVGLWATIIILIGLAAIIAAIVFGVINRPMAADDIGDMPEENPSDPAEPGEQDRIDRDSAGDHDEFDNDNGTNAP